MPERIPEEVLKANPPADPGIVLFHLHANVWWGAVLLLAGLIYCLKFAPRRS